MRRRLTLIAALGALGAVLWLWRTDRGRDAVWIDDGRSVEDRCHESGRVWDAKNGNCLDERDPMAFSYPPQ